MRSNLQEQAGLAFRVVSETVPRKDLLVTKILEEDIFQRQGSFLKAAELAISCLRASSVEGRRALPPESIRWANGVSRVVSQCVGVLPSWLSQRLSEGRAEPHRVKKTQQLLSPSRYAFCMCAGGGPSTAGWSAKPAYPPVLCNTAASGSGPACELSARMISALLQTQHIAHHLVGAALVLVVRFYDTIGAAGDTIVTWTNAETREDIALSFQVSVNWPDARQRVAALPSYAAPGGREFLLLDPCALRMWREGKGVLAGAEAGPVVFCAGGGGSSGAMAIALPSAAAICPRSPGYLLSCATLHEHTATVITLRPPPLPPPPESHPTPGGTTAKWHKVAAEEQPLVPFCRGGGVGWGRGEQARALVLRVSAWRAVSRRGLCGVQRKRSRGKEACQAGFAG